MHADWSVAPAKRWMCLAVRAGETWHLSCRQAGPPDALMRHLHEAAAQDGAVLGIDAPIGLPSAYAAQLETDAQDFPGFLARLPTDAAFFDVCAALDEVSLARPFFPRGVLGQPRRRAHAARLGIDDPDALLRRCDRKTANRPRAAPLFWTLGANQVGKAALSAWRDLLLPALAGSSPALLWPFAGRLHALLRPGAVVVAETYPAESLRQLALPLATIKWGSKRRQADRAALAPDLFRRLTELRAAPDGALERAVADGFGSDRVGEDRFDSFIGLLGLLHVLVDGSRDTVPDDDPALRWEGWILGQRNDA